MKRTVFCTLALLLALLTPAAANSAPTRLDGVGGSALEVDENCPVTVSAETLTFRIDGEGDYGQLSAQVTAVYQMENPTDEVLTVPMAFYLEERKGQLAGTLSGGEQQMLAMGRALMSHPDIILMDEPSMGLSPIYVNEIFDIIQSISASGTTVLLVEQNAHTCWRQERFPWKAKRMNS